MFDNLFGLAGPVGTAFVLFALLVGVVATFSLGRISTLQTGRARV